MQFYLKMCHVGQLASFLRRTAVSQVAFTVHHHFVQPRFAYLCAKGGDVLASVLGMSSLPLCAEDMENVTLPNLHVIFLCFETLFKRNAVMNMPSS